MLYLSLSISVAQPSLSGKYSVGLISNHYFANYVLPLLFVPLAKDNEVVLNGVFGGAVVAVVAIVVGTTV